MELQRALWFIVTSMAIRCFAWHARRSAGATSVSVFLHDGVGAVTAKARGPLPGQSGASASRRPGPTGTRRWRMPYGRSNFVRGGIALRWRLIICLG
jgi:hypothetical protein